jgi:hypothetical protein
MNKYNVKAIRDELDKFVSNRLWNAFRQKFQSLLPPSFFEEAFEPGLDAGTVEVNSDVAKADIKKLELCCAVVELKKQRSRMTGFTETCPSLLHDLCHKYQSNSSSWHQHNRPPPVPCDILEMVASVASRKIFLAQYGKRKQTPLALLLEHNPPAYVVEKLLKIITRREDDDKTEEERLQVLYMQDASMDTPLSQTIKRLPDADEIVELLVEHDIDSLTSLLYESRSGNVPLYYLLHRELKRVRNEAENSIADGEQDRDDLSLNPGYYQELPDNLLYFLFKTQRAVLLKQGLLHHDITDLGPLEMMESNDCEDEASTEGLFRVLTSDSDRSFDERATESIRGLQATICCAHLLSNEKDLAKMISILISNLLLDNKIDAVDRDGNYFLHWICMSRETNAFLDSNRGYLKNSDVLTLLLKSFPAALQARNADGKIPLHIALERTVDWKLIQRLLLESPQSARTRVRAATNSLEHQGRLPLHMALSKNIPTVVYHTAEIVELWNAFPDAVNIADPITRLFPFQLAAATATKRASSGGKIKKSSNKRASSNAKSVPLSKAENDIAETHQLTTIYALLRGSPESLQAFVL